jgi:hypothetical protein
VQNCRRWLVSAEPDFRTFFDHKAFPIIIGVRSFFRVGENGSRKPKSAAGVSSVAVVTFANGRDNIGLFIIFDSGVWGSLEGP